MEWHESVSQWLDWLGTLDAWAVTTIVAAFVWNNGVGIIKNVQWTVGFLRGIRPWLSARRDARAERIAHREEAIAHKQFIRLKPLVQDLLAKELPLLSVPEHGVSGQDQLQAKVDEQLSTKGGKGQVLSAFLCGSCGFYTENQPGFESHLMPKGHGEICRNRVPQLVPKRKKTSTSNRWKCRGCGHQAETMSQMNGHRAPGMPGIETHLCGSTQYDPICPCGAVLSKGSGPTCDKCQGHNS